MAESRKLPETPIRCVFATIGEKRISNHAGLIAVDGSMRASFKTPTGVAFERCARRRSAPEEQHFRQRQSV
jgi:hypothetical protein